MIIGIHAVAGGIATFTIAGFWISTAVVELFGDSAAVTAVKTGILYGMGVLILAMAITGMTGTKLARRMQGPVIEAKMRRMKIAAATGILVLAPSAVFLALRAGAGLFDGWFYLVQAVELVAGASNLSLMSRNMRDGLRLTAGRKRRQSKKTAQA